MQPSIKLLSCWLPKKPSLKWSRTLIVIDTLSVSKLPDVTQTQCAWLNDNLNATKHKPTFVAMHPPPIPTQILVKSEILDPGKNWCLDLKKIIESHPQIDIIACVRNRSSTHTDK